MGITVTGSKLNDLRHDLEQATARYLRERGWTHTSELGHLWLWRKEIDGRTAYVDEGTALWLEEREDPGLDEEPSP